MPADKIAGSGRAGADGDDHRTECDGVLRRESACPKVSRGFGKTTPDVRRVEIDLAQFRKAEGRSITFGLLTTSIPLLLGTTVGMLLGYSVTSAIVIGSLLESHTLLAAPIVTKLGANHLEPVTVTFGATIMSDTLS